jgi:hypothetical protein
MSGGNSREGTALQVGMHMTFRFVRDPVVHFYFVSGGLWERRTRTQILKPSNPQSLKPSNPPHSIHYFNEVREKLKKVYIRKHNMYNGVMGQGSNIIWISGPNHPG